MIKTDVLKEIKHSQLAELEAQNDRLQSAWYYYETICPDGSLRPDVSDLLDRVKKAEAEAEAAKSNSLTVEDLKTERDKYRNRAIEAEKKCANLHKVIEKQENKIVEQSKQISNLLVLYTTSKKSKRYQKMKERYLTCVYRGQLDE